MKTYKFNTSNQKIAIASDFHFFHNKEFIYKDRGFSSIEEHDKFIIDKINEYINENDVLIFLGDFSIKCGVENVKYIFDSIKCKNIYYIFGNHEIQVENIYRQEIKRNGNGNKDVFPTKIDNITFLGYKWKFLIDNQKIEASHFPPLVWDTARYGTWALCGHCHGNCNQILPEANVGKILDCGVDTALKYTNRERPFFFYEEIKEILDKKDVLLIDYPKKNID